jgi:hypothetical protein
MSTADEIFRLTGLDEPHIVINSDRSIVVPSELKDIAVQYDHNIETVTFDCPRYWDETDMSEMLVSINYSLANGFEDTYICPEVIIDETDDSIIHFSWTISNKVTQAIGAIDFIVCLKLLDADEIADKVWHSRKCTDLNVLPGKECDARIISEYEEGVRSVSNPLAYARKLNSVYEGYDFPDDYELILNVPIANTFNQMCKFSTGLKVVTLVGNVVNDVLDFIETFMGATSLEMINAEEYNFKPYDATRMFSGCIKLKEIKGQIDLSRISAGIGAFTDCYALEEIRFKPNTLKLTFPMTDSPLLSNESLQSLVDSLVQTSTSQTLYLHPTAASNLTEDQIIQITNKNWTVQ